MRVFLIVLGALLLAAPAWAEPSDVQSGAMSPERVVDEQLERLPLAPLDEAVRRLDPEVQRYLPADIKTIIFDGDGVRWQEAGRALLGAFFAEIYVHLALLGQLVVLGVFCAFLRAIAHGLNGSGAADVAFLVSLLVMLLLGLHAFKSAVDVAAGALTDMVDLLQALLPVMSMMLAAVGAITTAAIFHPLIYATVTGIATLVKGLLFPIVLVSATLTVIGAISSDFPLKHMEGLLKTVSLFLLGMMFIAFVGVVQVRSLVAPVADGLAIRTVKFATSTFIPVVGSRISDAMDLIVGGSVLIKNAIGLFGMAAVALVTAFPVVKILSLLLIFKLAAALVEPITDPRLVQAMSGLAGSIALLAAGVITAALMFFVGITVVVSVGNTAAVMR